jgi:hypothetical protein
MLLIDRQILGHTVELAGAGIDDAGARRGLLAGAQKAELRAHIERQVALGVADAVNVADLAGQVEDGVTVLQGGGDRRAIANARDDAADPALGFSEVEVVGAALLLVRVDDRDLRPEPVQSQRQVAADKSQSPRYEDLGAPILRKQTDPLLLGLLRVAQNGGGSALPAKEKLQIKNC